MSLLKKILLALLIVFIAIQFIQPARNTGVQAMQADITKQLSVPADVQNILKTSCYDCHSNNTRYPWYANIQPLGWLLTNHIKKGKAELNLDEFGNYTKRRKSSKLKSIANSVKDKSMPLASYTLLHKDAVLSDKNKEQLISWALASKDTLDAQR